MTPKFLLVAAGIALLATATRAGAAGQTVKPEDHYQHLKTVWAGVYTAEEANRGRNAVATLCARCHGADLKGGAQAPALTGAKFFDRWSDLRLADVVTYIQSAMPHEHDFFVPAETAREAFALAAAKLPLGTRFVTRPGEEVV